MSKSKPILKELFEVGSNIISNERGFDQLMAEFLFRPRKVCPDCREKLRRFKKLIEIEFEIRRTSLPSSIDLSTKHFERKTYEESYGICPRCKSAYALTPGNPPQRLNDNIKNNITNDKDIFDNIIRAHVKERIKNLKYRVLNIQTIDEGS